MFKNLNKNEITKLASVLEEEFVPENEVIVRQGAVGETFYIIRDGHVKVTELDQDGKVPHSISTYALLRFSYSIIDTSSIVSTNSRIYIMSMKRDYLH